MCLIVILVDSVVVPLVHSRTFLCSFSYYSACSCRDKFSMFDSLEAFVMTFGEFKFTVITAFPTFAFSLLNVCPGA